MIDCENDKAIRLLRDAYDGIQNAELALGEINRHGAAYKLAGILGQMVATLLEARHSQIKAINSALKIPPP